MTDDASGDATVETTGPPSPVDFWEERYAGSDRVWSGKVNAVLASLAPDLTAGRALDLGCGEGADAIWLARHGWTVMGIDISSTAIARAAQAARAAGLDADQVRFVAADLESVPTGDYELVTASFLHSPVHLAREDVLRRAAASVVPGGWLLITSHAAPPPWADSHGHDHEFHSPADELALLRLDSSHWQVLRNEIRSREAVGPDGQHAILDDGVTLLRRR